MNKKFIILIILILLISGGVWILKSGEKIPSGGPTGFFSSSPSGVVKAFLSALNEGKYSEAEKYVHSDSLNAMKTWGATLRDVTDDYGDPYFPEGKRMKKIEISREEVRGEGADVSFVIYYQNGEEKSDEASLLKENGIWKIVINFI